MVRRNSGEERDRLVPALLGQWDANGITRFANREFQAAVGLPLEHIVVLVALGIFLDDILVGIEGSEVLRASRGGKVRWLEADAGAPSRDGGKAGWKAGQVAGYGGDRRGYPGE